MKKNEVTVSAELLNSILNSHTSILKMYGELERLILEESELKKHHRAYLHVREQIDKTLRSNREKLIAEAVKYLGMYEDCKHKYIDKDYDGDDRDSCPCNDCASCGECELFPCCDEGDNDDAIVSISKYDFDALIDDVLSLAEMVDMVCHFRCEDLAVLKKYGRVIPELAEYEKNRIRLYKDCALEAEGIMDELEDAELVIM